jgi:hypothetical protein
LVKVGAQSSETEPARPRFIVCALPVSLKTAKTNLASRLATPLALELQIHFAQKGYFSYACDTASVDVNRLAAGGEVPTELKEPLGVAPDFVLDCEIEEGGDTRGFNLKTLRMRATLYDLHLKKTVWEGVQSMVGWSLADYLLLTGGREWSASAGFAKSATDGIHEAVEAAVKKLSPVSGFGRLKK